MGFVGALGLDFLTTVVLLLQLVDEVCRRTLTVVFACESCYCALLPIRGGAESDLQALICFCRLSVAVSRLSLGSFRPRIPQTNASHGGRQRRTKRKSEQSLSLNRVAQLRDGVVKHNLDDAASLTKQLPSL